MFNLQGKKGLVVGIANGQSIAFGCARAFKLCGAELAITYMNERSEQYVKPLAQMVAAPILMPMAVEKEGEMEAVFAAIEKEWGKLDFLVHSIAFAPRMISTAASPTAAATASCAPWTSPVTRSSVSMKLVECRVIAADPWQRLQIPYPLPRQAAQTC